MPRRPARRAVNGPGSGGAVETTFYDELAPYYHLLYADWEASVDRQGDALAAVLVARGVAPGARVLDAACGVGTQAIGLAERGYHVRASDLAPGAVARARAELARRGLAAELRVADLRALGAAHAEAAPFAAVLACDNAVPHLLGDGEIVRALRECHALLAPDGVLVLSVRDYAAIARRSPDLHPQAVRRVGDRLLLAVQVWEWEGEGDEYDLRLYLTEEGPDGACATRVLRSRYYAVTIDRLLALLAEAGFVDGERVDGAFFQPLVIARRAPVG
jgi:glycine/sarcosine N-methyltransferase